MNAEQFIEENYFGLKIDCQRDIQTIYQALEDYARALQLLQTDVSKRFTEEDMDNEYNRGVHNTIMNRPC
jgi:hypothetical protein